MFKKISIVIVLCFSIFLGKAQDVHFSHFFSMPIFQNPAFTGYMNGDVRVSGDFRMQWESFGEGFGNAYRTAAASADFGFLRSQTKGSTLGAGLTFINDQAGDLSLASNQVGLAVSYIQVLDKGASNYLGVGFHSTFTQRSVDINQDNAIFPDQFESTFVDGQNYFNLSAGLLWFFEPSDDINLYVGAAMHNIFRPNVSFSSTETEPLDRRLTFQFGSKFDISDRISLVPSIIAQRQGPSLELIFGTFVKYKYGNVYSTKENTNFQFGAFYRWGDAITPVVRMDVKAVSFVFSYDVNVSKLTTASKGDGGPEISFTYTGQLFSASKKAKPVKCPVL